tara:strand:- start:3974 stop:4306 length:333 start_codon:yes stop_codon:yes gene_type:complete
MAIYAKGKLAFGFCDRTGFRYPLNRLVNEIRNGVPTGFRVGDDVVDPDQPQNFLGRVKINDPQSLRNPRPERRIEPYTFSYPSLNEQTLNPFGPPQGMSTFAGAVTVSIT